MNCYCMYPCNLYPSVYKQHLFIQYSSMYVAVGHTLACMMGDVSYNTVTTCLVSLKQEVNVYLHRDPVNTKAMLHLEVTL